VANRTWGDLRKAIEVWYSGRRGQAAEQIKKDAEALKLDIVKRLEAAAEGKTPNASKLEERTKLSADTKEQMLMPKSKSTQVKADGPASMQLYTNSIIIDDESSGTNVVHVVKLDDMKKKDETTGMTLDKLAKAVEFGTSRSAPHPAWRRSLKKLEIAGVYKKKQ